MHQKIFSAITGTIYLYFDTGDLSLSATREAVHLDGATQIKIQDRLNEIVKDFKVSVQKKIDECKSIWDANVYFNNELKKTFSDVSFLGQMQWNGIDFRYGNLPLPKTTITSFTKGAYGEYLKFRSIKN